MRSDRNKIISLICAAGLLLGLCPDYAVSSISYNTSEKQNFTFGAPHAKITSFANLESDTLVINIQDYHSDYETQTSIKNLLNEIYSSGKNIEIYLEGAYKEPDLSHLQGMENLPQFDSFADMLLKNGKITGAELFSLKNGNVKLNGLEDLNLYLKNLKNLSYLLSERDEVLSDFGVYFNETNKKIISMSERGNKKLYGIKQKYDKGKTSHKKYISSLLKFAKKNNLDIKKSYPNIYKSDMLYSLESGINFKKVSSDMSGFLSFIKSILSYKDYMQIESSEDKFYILGKIYRDYSFKTPELTKFFQYTDYKETMNSTLLFQEENDLFWNIMNLQCSSSFQKQGAEYLRVLDYSYRLLKGEIVSYEYDYLSRNNEIFENAFGKYIGVPLSSGIKKYYDVSKEFYDINDKRNLIFIEKAGISENSAPRKGIKNAFHAFSGASSVKILVTGGYHSEGLAELLKQKGVSYIVFTPEISSTDARSKNLYEDSIKIQAKAAFSAFQKFLNSKDIIFVNNIFNVQNFCDIMLDYGTVSFFADQKEKGEDIFGQFTAGLVERANRGIPQANRINSIDIEIVSKEKNSFSLIVAVEFANGTVEKKLYNSFNPDPSTSIIVSLKNRVIKSIERARSPRSASGVRINKNIIYERYKARISGYISNFDMQIQFCKNNPERAELELLAPEILKTAAELMEAIKGLDKIYGELDYIRQNECENLIIKASEKYVDLMSSDFDFGSMSDNFIATLNRLGQIINEFGLETHENMQERFRNAYDKYKNRKTSNIKSPRKTYREIENKVMQYFARNIDSDIPVFAYASAEVREMLGGQYDEDAADMVYGLLKRSFFRKNSIKRAGSAQNITNALNKQSREIFPYFSAKDFAVENQEEIEDVLIRSLSALEILEMYPEHAQVEELIKMSQELFKATDKKIDIKTSEEAYLDALKRGDKELLPGLKKDLYDKLEYARRVTAFQTRIIKVIAEAGKNNPSSEAAAKYFILSVVDGSVLEGSAGMEGIYWLKQQAVLRLKDFNSPSVTAALNGIIDAENRGETPSPEDVFMSLNLDASNTKILSVKKDCLDILRDFKRQDARELLTNDINGFFDIIQKLPQKDVFAYVVAANDVLTDENVPSEIKASVFKGFASTGNKNILFSANLLLDAARNEFNLSKVNSVERAQILDFFEAFTETLSGFTGGGLHHITSMLERLRFADERSSKNIEKVLSDIRLELGDFGRGKSKNTDWISEHNVVMFSGGGVTEEIIKLGEADFSGKVTAIMSVYDNSGSSRECMSLNADKNGIASLPPGDVARFIAASAFLENSKAPLKNVIKDFINYRFVEKTSMLEAVELLRAEMQEAAAQEGVEKEFEEFWENIIYYASIVDSAGFETENGSVRNLILEAMIIDNMGYGEGFINPDGVYAAMKDFADLLGTESIALTDIPYGNTIAVKTKGGSEYLGQSYFSHTPHSLNGGRERTFWTPENIGGFFDGIKIESRVSKTLKQAKVIIAGLCSWITSLGAQLSNSEISEAVALNESADKILITNPVKDDENTMSWSESTVAFIQRISNQKFKKIFNAVFAWQSVARDRQTPFVNLTEKEIFDGEAGGYRGENTVSVSGMKLLEKLKVKLHIISGGIDIIPADRRDDPTKTNYRITANPKILSSRIFSALSRANRDMVYELPAASASKTVNDSAFARSTALFFGAVNADVAGRAGSLLHLGINNFVFMPISKAELEKMKLAKEAGKEVMSLEDYESIGKPAGFEEGDNLYFILQRDGRTLSTKCYYIAENEDQEKAALDSLAQWYTNESPALLENGLIRYDRVSVIESSVPEVNFDDLSFEGTPLKILIGKELLPAYDFAIDKEKAADPEQYVNAVLDEMRKPINDIASKLSVYKGFGSYGDKKNEALIAELKDLLISVDAWDDASKRASVLYALKKGFEIKVKNNGIRFFNQVNGKETDFYIDATGKFQASNEFMRKMRYLESLKVFADMDDNIAHRGQPFSDEMRDIFADLTLYGMCSPVLITGNTDETLWVRLQHLPKSVLEETVFYTEVGGLRYTWQKVEKEDGTEEYAFVIDEDYTENISKAGIPVDVRQKMRDVTANVDYQFDDLFVSFVKKTYGLENYEEFVSEALKDYTENNEAMKLIKKITGQGTKNLLTIYWKKLNIAEIQTILDDLYAVFLDKDAALSNGLNETISEEQYIEVLKIVSLLEYSRISFSDHAEDKNNKAVLLNEREHEKILSGAYKKMNADSDVRVSLTPIRVRHIKKMIADLYSYKFSGIPELSEYKVESSGRTTINIMKKATQKSIPIEYEVFTMKTPSGNIMYSGDEAFILGMSEANSGIDDSVARFDLEKGNRKMLVVNTNLSQHDTEKRPNLIWLADIMKRNGISVSSPVDAGVLLHEKILERLEYNFEKIMSDEDFEPENVIALLKETVAGGSLEFPVIKDFTSYIEQQNSNIDLSENYAKLLSAA